MCFRGEDSILPKTHLNYPIGNTTHGVSLIPLQFVDNDIIQRLQHGCTVIHYDVETTRSVLCHIRLDTSSGVILWQKHNWSSWLGSGKSAASIIAGVNNELKGAGSGAQGIANTAQIGLMGGISENLSSRWISKFVAGEIAWKGLDEGYLELSYVKNIEACDSYDFDIETIYRYL